jgi:hypothetical protein
MVSQAIASVDVWLAEAEEILQAQREHAISPSSVPSSGDDRQEWVLPLGKFESALGDLLGRLCRRPGRWILIAEDNVRRHHFWQALAFEDGSLVTETVSNYYLEGEDCWTSEQEGRLLALGWEHPCPPRTTNWINVEYTTSPLVGEIAKRAGATLRSVFGLGDHDEVFVKMFCSPIRGDTPASCLGETKTDDPVTADEDRGQPTTATRHFSRPDPDATSEELDAWARGFVDTILGPLAG